MGKKVWIELGNREKHEKGRSMCFRPYAEDAARMDALLSKVCGVRSSDVLRELLNYAFEKGLLEPGQEEKKHYIKCSIGVLDLWGVRKEED